MPDELSTSGYWDGKYRRGDDPRLRISRLRRTVHRLMNRKFDAVLAHFMDAMEKPAGNVLELGCAPGLMIQRMHAVRPQHHFHGIDYSVDGMEAARRRFEGLGIDVTLHAGDVREAVLPVEFDLVVSFGLIEHFDDPSSMLAQHARFCAPGGLVGVTVPNLSPAIVDKVGTYFAPETMATHNFDIMDPVAVERALEAAGLEEVTAGATGGPGLSGAVDPGRPFGGAYRRVARGWNFVANVLPFDVLWNRTIWGMARRPAA